MFRLDGGAALARKNIFTNKTIDCDIEIQTVRKSCIFTFIFRNIRRILSDVMYRELRFNKEVIRWGNS
jgi:hypothetical protein